MRIRNLSMLTMAVMGVLAACAEPQNPSAWAPVQQARNTQAPQAGASEKRITAAIFGEPRHLGMNRTNPGGSMANVPGSEGVEELIQTGLSTINDRGTLEPRLAEAVPSSENGLWVVQPDGRMQTTWRLRPGAHHAERPARGSPRRRMQTTWRLRPGATWHDGRPFTTDDLLFTAAVYRDREVELTYNAGLDLIESVEAPDPRTVVVSWRQPFIEADAMFTPLLALPLPRHLLEQTYADDRAGLMEHPYWTDEFVGTGPFRLRTWVSGSHVVLEANSAYLLGRPKIDLIEVRFIYDANSLIANILSGGVELTMGRGLDIEQSLHIKDNRRDIEPLYTPGGWVAIYPQFLNAAPPIVASDARFRRALLMATDRQEIIDTVAHGLVPIPHTFVHPDEAIYRGIEPKVVRYDFDPRRAGQMLQEIGYARGPDHMLRDPAGQPVSLEIWTTAQRDHHLKSIFPVASYWQRAGVGVETHVVPTQRVPDREYTNAFPAFMLIGLGNGLRSADLRRYHSALAPRPENRFQSAGNMARYMDPELDSLIERYAVSIPMGQRTALLGDIVRIQSEHVAVMGLFYQLRPVIKAQRLVNVNAGHQTGSPAWNVDIWDAR